MKWIDCGGGAQLSEDKRFYLQVKTRYLGRGKVDRFVTLTNFVTNESKDYGTIRLAKKSIPAE